MISYYKVIFVLHLSTTTICVDILQHQQPYICVCVFIIIPLQNNFSPILETINFPGNTQLKYFFFQRWFVH